MIALLGVGPWGLDPFGWRLPSALFGIAGVTILYLLALELWDSVWWAGLLRYRFYLKRPSSCQSRIAMLDIFLTTFLTAGFLFLVKDRKRMGREIPEGRHRRLDYRLFGSPFRFWAGFMFGAAVACKWSGFFALAFAVGLCTSWVLMGAESALRSRAASIATIVASFSTHPLSCMATCGTFFCLRLRGADFPTSTSQDAPASRHHIHTNSNSSLDLAALAPPDPVLHTTRDGMTSGIVAFETLHCGGASWLSFPLASMRRDLKTAERRGSVALPPCSCHGSCQAGPSSSTTLCGGADFVSLRSNDQ